MNTRYSDVYDGYIESPSSSEVIAKFKKELESKASNNYEKWSDFEMGMADYAKRLSSEDEFVQCVRDFKGYMVKHLIDENEIFANFISRTQNVKPVLEELDRSLEHFYDGLIPNDVNKIKAILLDSNIERNYITFNYTTSLETLFILRLKTSRVLENVPIHIHGQLGSDIVLGVDDPDQLLGTSYLLTKKGERAFVKPIFNELYDNARVESAKKAIFESSIICMYGFSMGESDNTWVWMLSDWLQADKNHHLIVYKYDSPKCSPHNYDEIMEIEEQLKLDLLTKRLQIEDTSVLDQIHIPVGRDIFNFVFTETHGATSPYLHQL